jgi:GNAT superfamily N-acetyltransferase
MIRPAQPADAHEISRLTELRRERYERYQPVFWRRAVNSREVHEEYLREELGRDYLLAYVLEEAGQVCGFAAERLVSAPEVYAPGGQTLLIDDFVVEPSADWDSRGPALLERVWSQAQSAGAAQMVVVCGHGDEDKRQMLRGAGLTIASGWWVGVAAEGQSENSSAKPDEPR